MAQKRFFDYIITMRFTFWMRVQRLLKLHNITQEEFAEMIGVSYNTLRGWIYHKRVPNVIKAWEMANILGVKLDYLAFGRRKPENSKIKPLKEQKEKNPVPDNKNILTFKL